jgi:hypothetical protein
VPFVSRRTARLFFDSRAPTIARPDHGTRSASSLKTAPASRTSEDRPHSHAAICARGQIAQALAIGRPDLIATLTIAAAGAGIMPSSDPPGQRRNTDEEQIREHGFEHFIRGHVENTHMAFGAQFSKEHPDVTLALSMRCGRQTSPNQHCYHYEARRTWDTLGNAPKVKVPTLILCGADDDVDLGGRTPMRTAGRLAELVPDSELALAPELQKYDVLGRRRRAERVREFLAAIS